jgi:GT2 family glycosyltransferase
MAFLTGRRFPRRKSLREIEATTFLSPEEPGFYRLALQFTADSPVPSKAHLAIGDPDNPQHSQSAKLVPVGRTCHIALRFCEASQRISLAFDKPDARLAGVPVATRQNERLWRILQLGKFLRRAGRRPDGLHRLGRQVAGLFQEGGFRAIGQAIGELSGQEQGLPPKKVTYAQWIKAHDYSHERDARDLKARTETLKLRPSFAVMIPIADESRLNDAGRSAASLEAQIYGSCSLYLCSSMAGEGLPETLHAQAGADRPAPAVETETGHETVSEAVNAAAERSNSDWLILLAPGTVLRENALAEFALAAERDPGATFLYSDEDCLDDKGLRSAPRFKPAFSRELLQANFYIGAAFAVRREVFLKVGGMTELPEGAALFDLVLRIVETAGSSGAVHVPKILFHFPAALAKPCASPAGAAALSAHLDRTGFNAQVERSDIADAYRVRPVIQSPEPLVSIVIPTRDNADFLKTCIGSILDKTGYVNFEIVVVDNGSTQKEAVAYLDSCAGNSKIHVFRHPIPFNFSALANFGVDQARGTVVGLLNNDMEVISRDWLTELVGWSLSPEIGCVGAKLYYADDTIQHGGVILGPDGIAGHAFRWRKRKDPGYLERAVVHQNLSAVTGACLFVRKEIYEGVGGFNEEHLAVAYNDVDFCLKVGKLGLKHVWTPYAELYHFESKSRGIDNSSSRRARFEKEYSYMRANWAAEIENDPYYSINFSRKNANYELLE